MGDSWTGAYESETATKKPIDEHLQEVLVTVQDHEKFLGNINSATRSFYGPTSDSHVRPIKIVADSFERVLPQDLIFTDNDQVRKVLTVIVFLCDEITQLKEISESRFFRPLLMFGQSPPEASVSTEGNGTAAPPPGMIGNAMGDKEKMLGRFLPFLQELSNFIDRCYSVVLNLVQQMASLMDTRELLYRCVFNYTRSTSTINALADLLNILISLDAIIMHNEALQDAWFAYKSMVSLARADPSAFATTDEEIAKFERLLVSVDQAIMIGEIFKGCIEQNFEAAFEEEATTSLHINVRSNTLFMAEQLLYCMRSMIDGALRVIGSNSEWNERYRVMGGIALYCLYRKLLPPNQYPDQKLHKAMWSIQKTLPVVVICENIMWKVGEFLMTHAYLEVKKLEPQNPEACRHAYIQQFDQTLNQRVASLVSQCKAWMLLIESRLQPHIRAETNVAQLLDLYGSILVKGLSLASRCSYLAKSCLVMHEAMRVPLSKANLQDVSVLFETLKAMEYSFIRKDRIVGECHALMVRNLCASMYSVLNPIRQKLQATRKIDSKQILLLTFLILMEHLVKSTDSFSPGRQVMLSVLAEIIAASPSCAEKDAMNILGLTRKIIAVSNLAKDIPAACDSSFAFFNVELLPTVVGYIFQEPTEANRLQYIVSAFEDGIKLCQLVLHTDVTPFFVNYRDKLRDTVRDEIVRPLCSQIETNLRLHIHTKHLDHMQTLNPKAENLKPLRPFLDLPPIRILGQLIDIKNEVTHYLDMNFYNLTTVALHDWRTYSDMRSLALEKLGLSLMDNFLPMGSLDQGLDVLQIMRNIHVFVSRFSYNMNMQQFVEFRPDKSSKHLNTIKIQSIAASIRQHGLGVLNTTVNFTYQFLSSKFHIFSQFLFDDYIRAHLSREHRWFRKHKNDPEVKNMYPYERALKFVRDIRKLGVNDAGKTFLDQFRILVTEIGNALGYVRMVRSASMYYCSEAVKFLPEFEDIINFEDYAGKGVKVDEDDDADGGAGAGADNRVPGSGANFCEETVRSAHTLDEVISTLVNNFGEGSDYFKVLVNVFQSVLLTAEHDHLKTFFMIVPALCISWIDASLVAKDNMYKTTRGVTKEIYFTDDGFAVGVAYCLAILKQSRRNESLHWTDSVNQKIKHDTKELKASQEKRAQKEAELARKKKERKKGSFFGFGGKKGKDDDDFDDEFDYNDRSEVQSLKMNSKKLEAYRRETEQLFYSMSGAEIFFKRTDVDT